MRHDSPGRTPLSLLLACLLGSLAAAPPASATWSVVAVDPATREVGIAAASCIQGVEMIAGVAPGRGVIAAQAWIHVAGRDEGVRLLRGGASPAEVVAALSRGTFDAWLGLPLHRLRQYGVAGLDAAPAAAAFTGTWTLGWAGAAQGIGVSVQGNMLYEADVVHHALAVFEAAADAPLAERLLRALEAGAAGGGDRRCSRAQSALSALLLVARPGDDPREPWLRIVAPGGELPGLASLVRDQSARWLRVLRGSLAAAPLGDHEIHPVRELRRRYEAWRRDAERSARGDAGGGAQDR